MVNFNNTEIAFKQKSNADLNNSYWLFKIIGWNWLINIGPVLLDVFLPLWFPIPIIKATIFKQFCGGESIEDCDKTITSLGAQNVKTILDYSVEGKEDEPVFDANVEEALKALQVAKSNQLIPFSVFKVTGFGRFALLEKINAKKELSAIEKEEFDRVKNRTHKICETAFTFQVPIFIDAEETWIQDVVDNLALEMMRKFNKEKAIIYNTAQMYRWDRLSYLKELKSIADEEDFFIGMKLVRGAYIEKERDRAEKMGYKDPMQKDKKSTDTDFNLALKFAIENITKIAICCGSHNEESSTYLTELMNQNNISANDERIYFAQLLGMSDHISMNLSSANFNVAKYVPYGPVKDVTPYLIRRAQENTSVAGQTSRELSLILKEKARRKG
ncbi:proline dehydrogenase [Vicingus serpentipes]|uniref:Proline dehydrogenase n=1 Tax=Vicingus serpentipes TaxID=1926625 RepID=A0A5C6RXV2_9FLAO|nr:proline dehydrogenase family protein [Vicingus serpentipes]TXB67198.1 proline dehydrogenase [Vicingus serpentipes]